jgi:flagellar hook-associated protein 3 FlgL
MRVADGMLTQQVIDNLGMTRRDVARFQAQLASGLQFSRPSEAPRAAARTLVLQNRLDHVERFQGSVEQSGGQLEVLEATLATLTELLQGARELSVAAGSGTLTAEDRARMAAEVEQIGHALFELGNTSWIGRHLYAGHRTQAPPLERTWAAGAWTYAYVGDHGEIRREIGPGRTVTLNLHGDAVFLPALETLESLRQALVANDETAIATTAANLHGDVEQALWHRSLVGVRSAHLEMSGEQLADMRYSYIKALSREQDADIALAAVNLAARESAYQASLAVSARLLQASLLDYLR